MNERLVTIPVTMVDPTEGNALGNNEYYINVPFDCEIVYVSLGADNDDADLTYLGAHQRRLQLGGGDE